MRLGEDVPVHHIMRFNEREATKAAALAGVSPEVVHTEPGVIVIRFIEGKTCSSADLNSDAGLRKVVPLIKQVHLRLLDHARGPIVAFWVFHVLRDYAHTLRSANSPYTSRLPELIDIAATLERAGGKVDVVFAHNDLLAANFIDDGSRLWLVDGTTPVSIPPFSISPISLRTTSLAPEQERWMLSTYFGQTPDAALARSYGAMKCASLLREAMWGMVSEIYSTLDFDYRAYTLDYLDRFARAYAKYKSGVGRRMSAALPGHAAIVVIGGGIIGCSTAYHLARDHKADVVLIDRGKLDRRLDLACGRPRRPAPLVGLDTPRCSAILVRALQDARSRDRARRPAGAKPVVSGSPATADRWIGVQTPGDHRAIPSASTCIFCRPPR